MKFRSHLFSVREVIATKCGAFASGYKPLVDAVNRLRTELATNFDVPSALIMAKYARELGLDDADDVKVFLGELVERGL